MCLEHYLCRPRHQRLEDLELLTHQALRLVRSLAQVMFVPPGLPPDAMMHRDSTFATPAIIRAPRRDAIDIDQAFCLATTALNGLLRGAVALTSQLISQLPGSPYGRALSIKRTEMNGVPP
jgi:hypothetical protein